jgi:hypothetical protein
MSSKKSTKQCSSFTQQNCQLPCVWNDKTKTCKDQSIQIIQKHIQQQHIQQRPILKAAIILASFKK